MDQSLKIQIVQQSSCDEVVRSWKVTLALADPVLPPKLLMFVLAEHVSLRSIQAALATPLLMAFPKLLVTQ
ncbi:MAG TPA: hypothetical protein VF797_20020 [Noviherbaspirillum sp.]